MDKTVVICILLVSTAVAGIVPLHAATAPQRDPFRVLVRPPLPPVTPPGAGTDDPRPPVLVKPLVLQVRAVVGESRRWVALIRYDGAEHIVEAGWAPADGKFTVRRIDDRGVLVELADDGAGPRQFLF